MPTYSLRHVENDVLLRDLRVLVDQDRATSACLLAHLGEVKERKLFAHAGQPHMHAYAVNVLGFSEDVASKRLQAAGAARRFPQIFHAIADGRLHLTGVCLLAPHLLRENADALISGAMGRTKAEIEKLLAEHFPQADVPESLLAIAGTPPQPVGIPSEPSDPGQMEGAQASSGPEQVAPARAHDPGTGSPRPSARGVRAASRSRCAPSRRR